MEEINTAIKNKDLDALCALTKGMPVLSPVLYTCCQQGFLGGVMQLSPCIVNDNIVSTALVFASKYSHLDIVQYLLTSHQPTPESIGKALVIACRFGKIDVVQHLLSKPYAIDISLYNDAVLKESIEENHDTVVSYLLYASNLKQHASLYHNDCSLLHNAIKENNLYLLDLLIHKHGMVYNESVSKLLHAKNYSGIRALFLQRDYDSLRSQLEAKPASGGKLKL